MRATSVSVILSASLSLSLSVSLYLCSLLFLNRYYHNDITSMDFEPSADREVMLSISELTVALVVLVVVVLLLYNATNGRTYRGFDKYPL